MCKSAVSPGRPGGSLESIHCKCNGCFVQESQDCNETCDTIEQEFSDRLKSCVLSVQETIRISAI